MAGLLYGLDLREQVLPLPVLHPAEVDDHIHLFSAVVHSISGHEALGCGGVIAVGEADDGADRQLARHILRRLLHIAGGDAHAGAAVLHAVIADGLDLVPGGRLGQKRVIALAQNVFQFHFKSLLIIKLSLFLRYVYHTSFFDCCLPSISPLFCPTLRCLAIRSIRCYNVGHQIQKEPFS